MASICGRNNKEPARGPVRICYGHNTYSVNGLEGVLAVQQLSQDTVAAQVPIDNCNEKRGEDFCSIKPAGRSRPSVTSPKRVAPERKVDIGP